MPILDSNQGSVTQDYSVEQLKKTAALMRGYILTGLCCAGSGHSGGTLSMMDITAALYLRVAKHDPRNPSWADRDRIFWSGGHKAPALYAGLAFAGFFDKLDLGLLRRLRSPLQGHPHWLKLPGVECSSGSLRARAERRHRQCARRPARWPLLHRLLHHGRWRAAGGTSLGSCHGGRSL